MFKVGHEFTQDGWRYKVRAVMQDRPEGGEAVIQILGRAPKPAAQPERVAPGIATAMLEGTLEPLAGARHLGYCEGLLRAAEMCEAHGIASGRSISVLIRNHAEAMRKVAPSE